MNKRIKELAEQAGVKFIDAHQDYFGENYQAGTLTADVDVEKFAVLIVQECCQHLTNRGYEVAREYIEKHFGVK